jgi:lipid II:glycine glycyltransferase (peptidoglycan interpeptide bridge formation enzyme)
MHGDGEAFLFVYYQSPKDIVIYPFLKRSLWQTPGFENVKLNLFDITSPYGYGGYLRNSELVNMEQFSDCFCEYCKENNIVSEFIRFHPIIENVKYVPKNVDIKKYNQTIVIELNQSEENIWKSMNQTCRNKIRKAIKNNIRIYFDENHKGLDEFNKYYINTMKRLGADFYYYFNQQWFYKMIKLLKNQVLLFHAYLEDKIIASAMFLVNYPYIHYFLTGTLFEARQLATMNLLLHEVAMWAKRKGLKYFHLGGGCFPNDSLFRFKASFSSSRRDFYIGGVVHHREYYEYLCNLRFQGEKIREDMVYYPLYRLPKKHKIFEKCNIF